MDGEWTHHERASVGVGDGAAAAVMDALAEESAMCGITGVAGRVEPVDPVCVRRMNDALRHRGPDDEGYLVVPIGGGAPLDFAGNDTRTEAAPLTTFASATRLVLGHRRLAILDLSAAGHQPMSNPKRTFWLVYNGEIYNFRELTSELQRSGYRFRSTTDAEVLVAAYERWGEECLGFLEGMWAFVVYDHERGVLFGARDRFGVKPLYYVLDESQFAFASEIKALLELQSVRRRLNEQRAFDFLVFDDLSFLEDTLFHGVFELKPAHAFRLDLRSWRFNRWRYYDLKFNDGWLPYRSDAAAHYAEQVRQLLENSVRRRMRADVPVGTCLSGGLDSSAIVCLSSQLLTAGERQGSSTQHKVFSACFKEPEADETHWAELVARHAGADWIKVYPLPDEFLDDVDSLAYCQDLPVPSPSLYAQYRVMRAAREHGITVLLDGQGGDELFSGYPMYHAVHLYDLLIHRDFSGFVREWKSLDNSPVGRWPGTADLVKQLRRFVLPYWLVRSYRRRRKGLFAVVDRDFWRVNSCRWDLLRARDFRSLNRMLHEYFTRQKLGHLLRYEDRNSMRYSIEARVPYVDDRELAEYVFSIAGGFKIHNGWSKHLLREAMQGTVPAAVLGRRDKKGFPTPERLWMDLLWPRLRSITAEKLRGFIEPADLGGDLWQRLRPHGTQGVRLMWRLVGFAVWRQVFRM